MNTSYQLVVIGAGSGGLTAARTAAKFGVKVAILEAHKIGGDCLHTGCVPSKSLISIARKIHGLKETARFTALTTGEADYSEIHKAIQERMQIIEDDTDNESSLESAGITVFRGRYSFTDNHTLTSENGDSISFKKCIIATGSKPVVPPIQGLDKVPYLTSDTIWDLTERPDSLAVIGGGPIGLELAQAYAMLGSNVTVFERGDRLMSRFDPHVGSALSEGLKDSGVNVVYNSGVNGVQNKDNEISVLYSANGAKHELRASHILVATGRKPSNSSLNLDAAGIEVAENGGITVDSKLRTSQKHIYAVGDCVGGPLFTHWAGEQGAAATIHALTGFGKGPSTRVLPNATFTTPEVAQVGKTAQELTADGTTFTTHTLPYEGIDKAVAEGSSGSVTVYLDKKDRILGAIIIGPEASEIVGYYAYLMHRDKKYTELATGVQAYPTYTIDLKEHAADILLHSLAQNPFIALLQKIKGMKK